MRSLLKYLHPRNYARRIRGLYWAFRYDLEKAADAERAKFTDAGLDAEAAEKRLNEVLLPLSGKTFDCLRSTDSVHWLLFAALSLTAWGQDVRRVLEIGTFRGKTTRILHDLFPSAEIVTCDLPEDDPILTATYGRGDPTVHAEHLAKRAANLDSPRIRLVEANSFFLPGLAPGPYDLIWVDGGHLYPDIAWDLCNAWHAATSNGVILCDDVFLDPKGGYRFYGGRDTFEALDYLVARAPAEVRYFLKRLNPTWSADPVQRKYVAMLQKRGEHPQNG
ncbi:MAG: class I SAM-dependent methyltransferase [Kiloniellales bacterium]